MTPDIKRYLWQLGVSWVLAKGFNLSINKKETLLCAIDVPEFKPLKKNPARVGGLWLRVQKVESFGFRVFGRRKSLKHKEDVPKKRNVEEANYSGFSVSASCPGLGRFRRPCLWYCRLASL